LAVGVGGDDEEILVPVEEPVADGEPVAVAVLDAEKLLAAGFAAITPPQTRLGLVLFPAFFAAAANAANVLFDLGSLMTPTIPVWQCLA
jgi:hypothetical protein